MFENYKTLTFSELSDSLKQNYLKLYIQMCYEMAHHALEKGDSKEYTEIMNDINNASVEEAEKYFNVIGLEFDEDGHII